MEVSYSYTLTNLKLYDILGVRGDKIGERMARKEGEKLVSIYTFKNKVELAKLKKALETVGIQVMIQPFDDAAYNGIFIPQKGVAKLWVHQKDAKRAREIIKEQLGLEIL